MPFTTDEIRDVLRAAATARGCTDWMHTVLGAGAAHRVLMDHAISEFDPGVGRNVLVNAGAAQLTAMTEPPVELVAIVKSVLDSYERVGRRPAIDPDQFVHYEAGQTLRLHGFDGVDGDYKILDVGDDGVSLTIERA